ncbi:MAG: MerR family transcriptional regulator [Actinomycetaceae bacterium]|nr:MerR family transcriptional regulator [Actinomycetaceae bacterium]
MPRPDLTTHLAAVPLSITATAQRLGISPSTLRTWERRYGLGPQTREAGKRRRYGPEEIEVLENVLRLVRSGVSPADAAASVQEAHQVVSQVGEETSIDDLANDAQNGCYEDLRRKIDILISRDGLLRTWSDYIGPVMKKMRYPTEGNRPGVVPRTMLTQAVLSVVYEVAEQCEDRQRKEEKACPVLIVTDDARELHAHIVGVSLQWEGILTRIVPVIVPASDPSVHAADMVELVQRYCRTVGAHSVIVMGTLVADSEFISGLDEGDYNLVLVGRHRGVDAAPSATRVRSLPACVEEAIEIARNCSYDEKKENRPISGGEGAQLCATR